MSITKVPGDGELIEIVMDVIVALENIVGNVLGSVQASTLGIASIPGDQGCPKIKCANPVEDHGGVVGKNGETAAKVKVEYPDVEIGPTHPVIGPKDKQGLGGLLP